MSVEELWGIHEEISKLLEAKMLAEKKRLEQRLISLHPATVSHLKARRPYPPVLPKFANPDEPSQIWAGRGKRPRWVIEKLATGLALGDLSIGRGSVPRRSSVVCAQWNSSVRLRRGAWCVLVLGLVSHRWQAGITHPESRLRHWRPARNGHPNARHDRLHLRPLVASSA